MTEPGTPIFATDWFSHNIPVWSHVLAKLCGRPDVQALEIGSFEGRSARWLLEHVLTGPGAGITCIDPWITWRDCPDLDADTLHARFTHNVAPWADRVTAHRGYSHDVVRALGTAPAYDLVYIDGDHHAASALEDAVLAFPLLKPGGLMIFDDYMWRPEDPPLDRPQPGIDAFVDVYADKLKVVHRHYQLIVEKL